MAWQPTQSFGKRTVFGIANSYVYGAGMWPKVTISRVPGVDGHNFKYKPEMNAYLCIDCGVSVTDDQLATTMDDDDLVALGRRIGDCVAERLRQNIRRVRLNDAINDFNVYLHNTSRSALSWALF